MLVLGGSEECQRKDQGFKTGGEAGITGRRAAAAGSVKRWTQRRTREGLSVTGRLQETATMSRQKTVWLPNF